MPEASLEKEKISQSKTLVFCLAIIKPSYSQCYRPKQEVRLILLQPKLSQFSPLAIAQSWESALPPALYFPSTNGSTPVAIAPHLTTWSTSVFQGLTTSSAIVYDYHYWIIWFAHQRFSKNMTIRVTSRQVFLIYILVTDEAGKEEVIKANCGRYKSISKLSLKVKVFFIS